jgi:two-component sensor histidine kinase
LLHSVFNLHRRGTDNKDARDVLQAGSESVETIGLLHHHLYRTGDFRKVNFCPYLIELVEYFKNAFSLEERGIEFQLECPNLEMDIDVAIPLGIVINELSTNSLKYAFENKEKARIALSVRAHNGRLQIVLADNGCGSTNGEPRNGTGGRLVELFGRKLGATLTRTSDENGTFVKLEFELPEKS